MRKRLICLGLLTASAAVLVGCGKKSISYDEFENALNSKNYTISAVEDDSRSITQYYDYTNQAVLTLNQFSDRIDKDYVFNHNGKAVSVVYINYSITESEYVMNENGKFEYYETHIYDETSIDEFFVSDYNIGSLFKNDGKKIVSAGVVEIPGRLSDLMTAEASNIKVKSNKITFDLKIIDVQDESNHAYDRIITYRAQIYDLGKTKVEITSEILADAEKTPKN